jgi:hypothetical protein
MTALLRSSEAPEAKVVMTYEIVLYAYGDRPATIDRGTDTDLPSW